MADLAAVIGNVVPLIFDVAGTARTAATLHLGKTGTYDPATDTTAPAGGSDVTVNGILYRSKQAQGTLDAMNRAMFAVQGTDAPSGIDEADTLTIGSVVWQIEDVERVPTNALYILHLRRA